MSSNSFEDFELSSFADGQTFAGNIRSQNAIPDFDSDQTRMLEPTPRPKPRKSAFAKDDSGLTVIDLPPMVKIAPAVGWLVCIEGVDKGQSFRLVKGNNPIGRPGPGKTYAVALSDQAISRKGACCVIVYNEKSNQFFITPGDLTANINCYLNDEILLSPKLLNPRAKLEIAGDVLIFVPFCSDKFKWNFDTPQQVKPVENVSPVREKIVRCPNGHFYDSTLNSSCPYCAEKYKENNDPDGATIIY